MSNNQLSFFGKIRYTTEQQRIDRHKLSDHDNHDTNVSNFEMLIDLIIKIINNKRSIKYDHNILKISVNLVKILFSCICSAIFTHVGYFLLSSSDSYFYDIFLLLLFGLINGTFLFNIMIVREWIASHKFIIPYKPLRNITIYLLSSLILLPSFDTSLDKNEDTNYYCGIYSINKRIYKKLDNYCILKNH